MMEGGVLLTITVLVLAHLIIGKCGSFYFEYLSKFVYSYSVLLPV
jgi:hypothetical protein